MVPVLGGSHELSQTSRCKSNQRQLVLAATSYRNDHNAFPPAITTTFVAWDDDRILWQYIGTKKEEIICPNHTHPEFSATGYNYNTSFIGDEGYFATNEIVKGVAPSSIAHPSQCAMFGDCSNNKFMRSPQIDALHDPYTDQFTRCAGMQAFRHQETTVVGWLDGHVTTHRDKFNTCNDEENGFLSEDNSAYDPRTYTLR